MPEFEKQWKERFRDFARQNDDDAGIAGWSGSGLETRFRQFVSACPPERIHGAWLDAGCGAGTYSRFLAASGASVVALDYSVPTVRKAVTRRESGVRFVVADVNSLPLRSASFDGVLCFGVTQALAETAPALRELVAVCKPGGQVWVDALNRWCVPHVAEMVRRRIRGKPRHLRYESVRRVMREMRAAGLRRLRLHWMPIVPQRWQALQPILEGRATRWVFTHVPLVGLVFCHSFMIVGERLGADEIQR